MCLIVFAWKAHPDYRLILGANRDEFHARPTRAAQWWPDQPSVLAGRDLQAGGTWLGIARNGRMAAVTNFREHQQENFPKSRGELVSGFLVDGPGPREYADAIPGDLYAGFSLLLADEDELVCVSNRGARPMLLDPGIYGLSNAALDTPWPKLLRAKEGLLTLIDDGTVNHTHLLKLLADRTPSPVSDITTDELPFELARSLSATFVVREEYGTRCSSTVIVAGDGRTQFTEHSFDSSGAMVGNKECAFSPSAENG